MRIVAGKFKGITLYEPKHKEIRPLKDGQSCFNEILCGKSSSPKIILKP